MLRYTKDRQLDLV